MPHRTFAERFALLPQEQRITFKQYTSSYGSTYWRAFWTEGNGRKESKTRSLYIGKDDEAGTIAAYVACQKQYKHYPLQDQVLVRDVDGKPVYVDEEMAHFFKPPLPYKKIYVNSDGERYVIEYGSKEGRMGMQYEKQTSLMKYIWEVVHERTVERGHEIMQKDQGNDYCSENLASVPKQKKESAA